MSTATEPRLILNTHLLRERIPNLTAAARAAGLRVATVSNLLTGRTDPGRAETRTLHILARLAHCRMDDLLLEPSPEPAPRLGYADLVHQWAGAAHGVRRVHGPRVDEPLPETDGVAFVRALPEAKVTGRRPSPRRTRRTF